MFEDLEHRSLLALMSITPMKDNTLIQELSGASSNGAGDIFVGLNNDADRIRRGLVAFDVAGSIPAGSTINSATLTMWANRTHAPNRSIELHKVLANWGEAASQGKGPGGPAQTGDATWLHTFYKNQFWTTQGGDFSPTVSSVQTIGAKNASYTWNSSAQMVADVQSWLGDPSKNFGWLLKGDETQQSSKRFDSRDSATTSHRPTLTIDYTPPATNPNISINNVTVTEGNAGTVNATFDVLLSAASTQVVTVNFATANGTATVGADYQVSGGTLSFAPGQTAKTISVPVVGDTVVEANETFTVNLSGATNATIATSQGQGTITNDDSATLAINDVTLVEGNAGTTDLTFTVTLNAAVDVPVNVNYTTTDGSAKVTDGDYVAASGTLAFAGAAGESKTIKVAITGDQKVELSETILANLSNLAASGRNVTLADSQGQGTITNDDSATLAINDVTIAEGNTGTTNLTFTVTLSAAVDAAVNVNYATANGSATVADGDYTAASGTLAFTGAAGETKTITVPVTGDVRLESNEDFLVNLTNVLAGGRGVTIADSQGRGTITNDDGPALPTLTISDTMLAEGDAGTSIAQFHVLLSAASTQTVNVNFTTANGTAIAGSDYLAASGTLTFAPGETSKTVDVSVNGDAVVELPETFAVNLSAATNATIADAAGQGTISNDDGATLVINDVIIEEGNSGTKNLTLTVTLNGAVDVPMNVSYSTADGSAKAADSDYVTASGTLAFTGAAGESKTITVAVTGDQKVELDESILVNLANLVAGGRNVTLVDSQGQGTLTNDDSATLSINDVTLMEGQSGTTIATFDVTLSGAVDAPVGVGFATADGTATTAGNDYAAAAGTLAFNGAAGETKKVTVVINGDRTAEFAETFNVNLSALSAGGRSVTIARSPGVGTISNDDAVLRSMTLTPLKDSTLTQDAAGAVGNGAGDIYVGQNGNNNLIRRGLIEFDVAGSLPANATIQGATLSLYAVQTQVGDRAVELHKVLADWGEAGSSGLGTGAVAQSGDATWLHTFYSNQFWSTAGGDFTSTASAVQTVGAQNAAYQWNSTSLTADVQYWLDHPDANFGWLLKSDESQNSAKRFASRESSNADQQPSLTITYVENPPIQISIGDASITEGQAGNSAMQFTVSLSGPSQVPVTVAFATTGGAALEGIDYQAVSSTLTFAPNETTKSITVNVKGDQQVELDESFTMGLSAATGGTIVDGQASGMIRNDDQATLTINDVTLAEGNSGSTAFTFTVTLSAAVDVPLSVDFATADGTATVADADFATATGTLNFTGSAGETKTLTVLVPGDQKSESDETFFVNLSKLVAAGRNVTIVDGQGVGKINTDDQPVSGVYFRDGILQVIGTAGNDRVSVSTSRGQIRVVTNFADATKAPRVSAASVRRIDITLLDGNDTATIDANVPVTVMIDGGAGDDTLRGGSQGDILLGGEGNDKLFGGGGADFLIGGNGSDEVHGGNGSDLLVSGTTAHDANGAALLGILAEWNSRRDFETRLRNISGNASTAASNRANADYFLIATGSRPTVFTDKSHDSLFGERGRDWLFGADTLDGSDDNDRDAEDK